MRVLIVGLAVVVALGLVVIGGTALFGTLTSDSGSPTESVSPSSGAGTTSGGVFAEVTVIGPTARLLATVPTTKTVIFNENFKKGDRRILRFPDVDLTIYTPKAVTLTLGGKLIPLDTSKAQVGFNIKDGKITKTWVNLQAQVVEGEGVPVLQARPEDALGRPAFDDRGHGDDDRAGLARGLDGGQR